ncbi:MAG: hypothetical protein K2I66_06040 [Bacteroidales bacterium]|nr:hypothetical protein [Bacteroidales bacterium]
MKTLAPLCLLCLAALCACQKKIPCTPDENFSLHRYETYLMEADTAQLQTALENALPEFELFLQGADLSDPVNLLRIRYFLEDPVVEDAYAHIEKTYGDGKALHRELACLFGHVQVFFPDFKAPEVYTYISYYDFVNRILYHDSILTIALDLYLDNHTEALDEAGIPRYLSRRFNSAHLLPDIARVIGAKHIQTSTERVSLLDHIASDGKLVHFITQVCPDADMERILGFSHEEYLWCKAHEKEVWQYIVRQNLLFETDPFKFRYFVNEGPFNPLLPGAPARLSQFIGLRIVERYLKKNEADFSTLLACPPRELLRLSGYKP